MNRVIFLILIGATINFGQPMTTPETSAQYELEPKEATSPSFDFWGGLDYRNFTGRVDLPKKMAVNAHYYGVFGADVGAVGLTKTSQGKHLSIYYGGGVAFGRGEPAGPALLLGAEMRFSDFSIEAKGVQAFRPSAEKQHDNFFQSSGGWDKKSLWFGVCVERLHHREEREWSGGPCAQVSVGKKGLFLGASLFWSHWDQKPTPIFGVGFRPKKE